MREINFTPFPTLTTARLILRQLTTDDDKEIFAIRSDEQVNRYLDRAGCKTIDEARQFIDKINTAVSNNESIYWAIARKNQPGLIGTICLWNISKGQSKAEIGFELLPQYQGKGFMQEAVTAVIEYGFKTMKLRLIEGVVDPNNARSIKLMEKNNFRLVTNTRNSNPDDENIPNTVVYELINDSFIRS
jgi:ribosomal-protein-alanine N-acetyltransferase